jgi:hypothetical protein
MNGGAPAGWKTHFPIMRPDDLLRTPSCAKVYAIVSSWFDGDIIEATVRNCFQNGCEKVFLLDNDSPDDSVKNASKAGAEVAEVYRTEYYNEDLRIKKQNEFVRSVVERENHEELWFVFLDADEFLTGWQGEPFAHSLRRVPPQFRTVGSNAIDLYPSGDERYIIGEHPAKCMSKGMFRQAGRWRRHERGCWKHVPLLYRNGVYDIAQCRGNHAPSLPPNAPLVFEPDWGLWIFHAPIRREEDARRRLRALCAKGSGVGDKHRSAGDDQVTGGHGAIKRFRSLDAIFRQDWANIEQPHSQIYGRTVLGVTLYPWRKIAPELSWLFNE